MTARHAALETWWHTYTDADWERGRGLLTRFGVGDLADRTFGTLSEGERQRTLLARSLMPDPELILLDEPTAAVDLAGREALVTQIRTAGRRWAFLASARASSSACANSAVTRSGRPSLNDFRTAW